MKQHKILYLTPFYGVGISPYTQKTIESFLKEFGGLHETYTCAWLANSRNHLVTRSYLIKQTPITDRGFTHVMWVDWDNSGTCDDLEKLILHDLPIVSAIYKMRDSDLYTAGNYERYENKKMLDKIEYLTPNCGLQKCDFVPFGFTLIKAEVFDKMRYPYFRQITYENRVAEPYTARLTGEDEGFCYDANAAGIDVYCDTDVVVNHHAYNIDFNPVIPEDFKQ